MGVSAPPAVNHRSSSGPTAHPWPSAVVGLAFVQVVDGVCGALRLDFVEDCFDAVGAPERVRWAAPVSKFAAAAGLLSGLEQRGAGRASSAGLILYFTLAVGAHVRADDYGRNFIAACGMLGTVSAVTLPFWRRQR